MTTVFACLQDIIAKGPKVFIRGSAVTGGQAATDWEPAALMDDMRETSPAVLDDPAWMEWSARPTIGASCFIHYGVRGYTLGHMEVPGYGNLRALELNQKRQTRDDEGSRDARGSLSCLLGC